MPKVANSICRVCREDLTINNYKNIKSSYKGVAIKVLLGQILLVDFNSDNDFFPKNCCLSCTDIVYNAYELKKVSIASETHFRCQLDYEEVTIKDEHFSDEEVGVIKEEEEEAETFEILIADLIDESEDVEMESVMHEEVTKTFFNPQMLNKGEKYRDTFYACSFCEAKMKPLKNLLRHMETKHDPILLPFSCNSCILRFKTEDALEKHQCPHSDKAVKVSKCEICSATGSIKSGMAYHMVHDHRKKMISLVVKEPSCDIDELEASRRQVNMVFHPRSFNPDDSPENSSYDATWFSCNFCDKVIKQKYVMLRHMKNLHNPTLNPVPCVYCVTRFKSEDELQQHLKEKHEYQTTTEVLLCDYCGVTGTNKKGMENHMIDDHLMQPSKPPSDSFHCSECDLRFNTKRYYTSHMVKVHDQHANFQCDKCAVFFKDRKELTYHVMKDHEKLFRELRTDEIEINLKCCKCEEEFELDELLATHLETHEENFERTKCFFCVKVLRTYKEFNEHAKFHAQPQTHICLNCKRKYPFANAEATFFNHLKGHKRYEIYKISCKKCTQTFRSLKDLEVHDKIKHKKLTLFICSTCGKSMSSSNALDQHIRYVHNKDKEKRFSCKFCDMSFVVLNKMKRHEAIHSKERPHVCAVCGSSFKLAESLAHHMKRHNGTMKRNHICSQCDRTFYEKNKLDQHMLTHTGLKPHECKYCDRAYACKGDLIKHMQKLHVGDAIYPCEKCDKAFPRVIELREHQAEHGTKEN